MITMYKSFSRWKLFFCSVLILNLIIIVGCNKNKTTVIVITAPSADTTPPIVTLKGKAKDTITLGNTFTDLGASAIDEVDGDISSSIEVRGSVNIGVKGTYTLGYMARDAARNSSDMVIRTIYVKNDVDYLDGTYNLSNTTILTAPGMVSPTTTVDNFTVEVNSSLTTNNSFNPSMPGYFFDGLVTVNGFSITTKYLYIHGENPINGYGIINSNKKSFTLYLTEVYLDKSNVTKNCTAIYTKL